MGNYNTKILDYNILSPIKKDCFSKYWLVHKFDKIYIIQILNRNFDLETNINKLEIRFRILFSRLNTSSILNCIKIKRTIEDEIIFVYKYKYYFGSSLMDRKFTFSQIKQIILTILNTLVFLYNSRIAHTNLCLSNIFYWNSKIKIGGFELALLEDDENYRIQNISKYTSPEICIYESHFDENEDFEKFLKGDVWSVGIIFWYLFHNQFPPFSGQNLFSYKRFICDDNNYENLVNDCLILDYHKRLNPNQLLEKYKNILI